MQSGGFAPPTCGLIHDHLNCWELLRAARSCSDLLRAARGWSELFGVARGCSELLGAKGTERLNELLSKIVHVCVKRRGGGGTPGADIKEGVGDRGQAWSLLGGQISWIPSAN